MLQQQQGAKKRHQSAPRLRRKNKNVGVVALWNENPAIMNMIVGLVVILIVCGGGLLFELSREQKLQQQQQEKVAKRRIRVKQEVPRPMIKGVSQPQQVASFPHFVPKIPYMPIFASIPNEVQLAAQTADGSHPTLAGIVSILSRFLRELNDANQILIKDGQVSADLAMQTFFRVANEYIRPFENQFRGRSLFPIREDESVFLSLAAYREHLLADTLTYAYKQAKHPEKLYVGAVVQNCFGRVNEDGTIDPSGTPCKTGLQVTGTNAQGRDQVLMSAAPADKNGIDDFCSTDFGRPICDNGQIRVLYVDSSASLGPAMARYHASKLWGGETYFVQCDSHLQFAEHWEDKYIQEIKITRNYPKSVLSSYPPGFQGHSEDATVHESNGARLCRCETKEEPNPVIRINSGAGYIGNETRPTQIPFIAAGFFFARSEFLIDVPFDPFLPWCFMGEEIALSIRAWTSGWDIYAPRKNLIAHQYRPGRLGLPKFWESVNQYWHRPGISNRITGMVVRRVKHMVGYPDSSRAKLEESNQEVVLMDIDQYSMGNERSWQEYMDFAQMHIDHEKEVIACSNTIPWCNHGEKD